MQQLALWLIALYRRFLSPYKGFRCAHRVHRGGLSCSAFGERAIQRHGARAGLLVLRRRLQACGRVQATILEKRATRLQRRDLRAQSGDCDFPITDLACPSVFDCACSGCDWKTRKKKLNKRVIEPSSRQPTGGKSQQPIPSDNE